MLNHKKPISLCCAVFLGGLVCSASATAFNSPLPFDKPQHGETIEAVFGKKEQVSANFDHWTTGSQIIVGGGGPFLDSEISLDANIVALAQKEQLSFVATNDKRIVVINWSDASGDKNPNATPRILQSVTVNAAIGELKTFDRLLLASTVENEILFFSVDNDRLQAIGSRKFDAEVSDISIDAQRIVVLLASNSLQSFNYRLAPQQPIQLNQAQSVKLAKKAQSIAHSGDKLFVAGADMGISLYRLENNNDIKLIDNRYSAGQAFNMFYQDDVLYVADGDIGATVYRVDDKGRLQWMGSHSKLGSVNQIWSYADKILIRNERLRLAELNFDDPSLPITGDIYKPTTPIDHAAAADGFVYAAYSSSLKRIDFQRSGATQISNEGINLGGSRRAFVKDHIAYVADWFSGLHIYDMRIPQQPRHLGNYHTPGSSKGVVVENNIAYVADDDHGLQIIDVSNPSAPRLISHISSTGLAYTLKYHRKKIYLADHRGGFHIIDVANPQNPREITHYDTPGKAWAIAVKNNTVFVADDQSGLLVFDVSNAAKPKKIGQYKPGGYAEDLQIVGNIAYVSFFDQGLHIIDISKPRKPRLIAELAIPGNARSVTVRNNVAYIAGWESGLQVVDVSDNKHPRLLANLDTNGSTWGVDIEGDNAYLWDWWGGVKVADISNPQQPRLLGQYQDSDIIRAVDIEQNHAFVAQSANGLQVFDVTNPANPIWMTGLNLPGTASSISASADRAYVALGGAGIAVVDISNPFQLRLLAHIPVAAAIRQLLYHHGALYVATANNEILVFDAQANTLPKLRQRIDAAVNQWAISGNNLIISSDHGIQSLSLQHLTATGPRYLPATSFSCLAASDSLLAACDQDGAIHVVRRHRDSFERIAVLPAKPNPLSLLLQEQWLFINDATTGVEQFDISVANQPRLLAQYRATGSDNKMALYKDSLLFSGNRTLNSLPLAPTLSALESDGEVKIQLPGKLSMGYYHLWIRNPNGDTWFYPNSLHVGLKRARKPAISMEKFKQLMQQQLQKSTTPEK